MRPCGIVECDMSQTGVAPDSQFSKCAVLVQVFRLPILNVPATRSTVGQG